MKMWTGLTALALGALLFATTAFAQDQRDAVAVDHEICTMWADPATSSDQRQAALAVLFKNSDTVEIAAKLVFLYEQLTVPSRDQSQSFEELMAKLATQPVRGPDPMLVRQTYARCRVLLVQTRR